MSLLTIHIKFVDGSETKTFDVDQTDSVADVVAKANVNAYDRNTSVVWNGQLLQSYYSLAAIGIPNNAEIYIGRRAPKCEHFYYLPPGRVFYDHSEEIYRLNDVAMNALALNPKEGLIYNAMARRIMNAPSPPYYSPKTVIGPKPESPSVAPLPKTFLY